MLHISDFDKAVIILEKKLDAKLNENPRNRGGALRQSAQFTIVTKEPENDVIIDPSMLQQNHLKGSFSPKASGSFTPKGSHGLSKLSSMKRQNSMNASGSTSNGLSVALATAVSNVNAAGTTGGGTGAVVVGGGGGTGPGTVAGSNSGAGGGSISQHQHQQQTQQQQGFPTGAHVPASFYKEIEEQLADALFKRTQAKLLADPDQANVESALADGLKVRRVYSSIKILFWIFLI